MCGEERAPSWQQEYYARQAEQPSSVFEAPVTRRRAIKLGAAGFFGSMLLSACTQQHPEGTTLRAAIDNGEGSLDAFGRRVKLDDELPEKSDEDMVPYVGIEYVVQPGQTLEDVAKIFFTDTAVGVQSVVAASGIADPAAVTEGAQLRVWITDPVTAKYSMDVTPLDMEAEHNLPAEGVAILSGLHMNDTDVPIPAGEEVVLPRQRGVREHEKVYIVQPGETTYDAIAEKNQVDPSLMRAMNAILDGDFQPGQVVAMPLPDHPALQPEVPPPAPVPDVLKENPAPPSKELPGPERLKQYVSIYKPFADHVREKYGVPVAVTLAMAQHESDYGSSELAVNAYNFHGLKANNGWKGEVYEKETREELPEDVYLKEKAAGRIVRSRGKNKYGKYDVDVMANFRKFPSVAEGFLGYGEKLKSEGNYPDAFDYPDDPLKFFEKLIDDNGPKYATDSEYQENVRARIKAVQAVLGEQSKPPEQPPAPEADSPLGRIEAVRLTVEGYNAFVETLDKSYIPKLKGERSFNPARNGVKQGKLQKGILHFTAGRSKTVDAFINVMTVQSLGVQFWTSPEGKVYQLMELSGRASHCPPFNDTSIGNEVEAIDQKAITTKQYEGLAYSMVYAMKEGGISFDNETADNPDRFIWGHAERRAIDIKLGRIKPSKARSDFPVAETRAMQQKIVELGKLLG